MVLEKSLASFSAPLPDNETERLDALHRYAILDTPPEAAFDRVVRLAARFLEVPIAMMTLVDEHRQWFKAAYGSAMKETSRELSFCAHAILGDETLVIPDATHDERFRRNALVTGPNHLRFYAGVPLRTSDGFHIGALCAIDREPRSLSTGERQILEDFAVIVEHELELRLASREQATSAAAIYNLGTGVIITDPNQPDNPIVFANPGFCKMTGYSEEEIIGRNCRFLKCAESDAGTLARLHKAVAAKRPFHGELLNRRKDGTAFWNELTISPVTDADGKVTNLVGLEADITERKISTEKLQQSYDSLRTLENQRDSLTHMIIHDLRTPLTTATGYLELLEMVTGKDGTPDQLDFIARSRESVTKLQEMITSLLDVNRLEAGAMPLAPVTCDLRFIVRRATDAFRPVLDERTLVCELPPHPVNLECDPELIQRVVANLVGNAVKFTASTGTIKVSIAEEGGQMKVSVADNGPGIPAECQARIFEKFGQVNGQKHRHSTGLGLTFCKLAVTAHGGSIGVSSTLGSGATFWFSLPAK